MLKIIDLWNAVILTFCACWVPLEVFDDLFRTATLNIGCLLVCLKKIIAADFDVLKHFFVMDLENDLILFLALTYFARI